MTLVEHARRELARTGEDQDVVDWYCRVITEFASFGHSGGSAMCTIPVLHELLQFHALTPLTDDPAEWADRSTETGRPFWQNIRDSSAFSEDAGANYWLLAEDAGDGIRPLHQSERSRP